MSVRLRQAANGYYSYWNTGRDVPLRELLVNEGLAVVVALIVEDHRRHGLPWIEREQQMSCTHI
jgi:hypothetical protein